MSKSRSFTSKLWITAAIANSIKRKNKICKNVCKKKKQQQREIYGKQFKTYRKHLMILLKITRDEYYKTYFKERNNNILDKIHFTTEDFMKHSEVIKKIKNTLL